MKGVEKSFIHIICSRYSRWSIVTGEDTRYLFFPDIAVPKMIK